MSQERRTTRVQLELTRKSMDRLEALKTTTEAASYAEVMKNSLRLYEFVIQNELSGATFLAQSADGKLTTIQLL